MRRAPAPPPAISGAPRPGQMMSQRELVEAAVREAKAGNGKCRVYF